MSVINIAYTRPARPIQAGGIYLAGVKGIAVLPQTRFAMSHFTIHAPNQIREAIQVGVWNWVSIPERFSNALHIRAARFFRTLVKIASEVLNLPIATCLTEEGLNYIRKTFFSIWKWQERHRPRKQP
jgi:hypothetical protein